MPLDKDDAAADEDDEGAVDDDAVAVDADDVLSLLLFRLISCVS